MTAVSPTHSLPCLPVLHLAEEFVIVHKPTNMLSVPGKVSLPPRQMPRYMEWITSIQEAARSYDASSEGSPSATKTALDQLSLLKSFPRKEKPFKLFVRKTLKLDDVRILDNIWTAVVQQDRLLHSTPIAEVPFDWISAAEICEARFGKVYHVHRLDMATSGALLFARSEETCNLLAKQFRDRSVGKVYLAEVLGRVKDPQFEINVPIRADIDNRPRQVVDFVQGKASVTIGRVLEYRMKPVIDEHGSNVTSTVVELVPLTGRTHQLRLHLSHFGHPILGDDLYSSQLAQDISEGRLHLHAYKLVFSHPYDEREYTVLTKCPFYESGDDEVRISNKRKLVTEKELDTPLLGTEENCVKSIKSTSD